MMRLRSCRAREQRPFEAEVSRLPGLEKSAKARLARIRRVKHLPDRPQVVDIGSGSGGFIAAFSKQGCDCQGIEPWAQARENTERLSQRLGMNLPSLDGTAESVPLEDDSVDIVHASNVIEHVKDIDKAFSEAHRVLRPGGVFWFSCSSSLSPGQREIRFFPFFGWYPNSLKIRIMEWAAANKPSLVGHTETPALHWLTPWHARRLLQRHGFDQVYDRWDVRGEDEGGQLHRVILRVIRSSAVAKFIADVVVTGCSYVAVKRE